MATGLDLVRMPGFAFPENAKLDFAPLRQALQFRADVGLRQQQADREMERLGLDRDRFGLQRDQFGLDRDRFGLQRDQFTHQQQQDRDNLALQTERVELERQSGRRQQDAATQAEAERRRVRMATLAHGIWQQHPNDPSARAVAFSRLVQGSPVLREYLNQHGFPTGEGRDEGRVDHTADEIIDYLRAQVQDAPQRFQPAPLIAVPAGASLVDPATRRTVVTAPSAPRPLSGDDRRRMVDDGVMLSTVTRLGETFQDNWTWPGPGALVNAGDYANWIARHSSSRGGGGENARNAAAWWQDYQRNIELFERNRMFGASLTTAEQAAWRAASITPNMNPDLIRRNLRERQRLQQLAISRYAQSLIADGYSPDAIAITYGIDPRQLRPGVQPGTAQQPAPGGGEQQPGPPPGGGQPVRITTDAEFNALPSGTRFVGPDGRVRIKP